MIKIQNKFFQAIKKNPSIAVGLLACTLVAEEGVRHKVHDARETRSWAPYRASALNARLPFGTNDLLTLNTELRYQIRRFSQRADELAVQMTAIALRSNEVQELKDSLVKTPAATNDPRLQKMREIEAYLGGTVGDSMWTMDLLSEQSSAAARSMWVRYGELNRMLYGPEDSRPDIAQRISRYPSPKACA